MSNKLTFGMLLMQMQAAAINDPAIVNMPVAVYESEVNGYYEVDRIDIVETVTHFGNSQIQLQPMTMDVLLNKITYYAPAFNDNDNDN